MNIDDIKKNFIEMKERRDEQELRLQQSRDAMWLANKIREIQHNSRANVQDMIALVEGDSPHECRRRLNLLAEELRLDLSKGANLKVQEIPLHARRSHSPSPFLIQCSLEDFIAMF
jgi:hypothetical protein